MLPDVIHQNPNVSIFYDALVATGLRDKLFVYKDESYEQPLEKNGEPVWHDYNTGGDANNPIREAARAPEQRLLGFTAFIVPDSVLKSKYSIYNVTDLYNHACNVYPEGSGEEYFKIENATDPRNPLYKLIAYHLLDRNAHGYNLLTVVDDIGIDINKQNPTEWFGTLLPYAMMKVEKLTVRRNMGLGTLNDRYINRRVDDMMEQGLLDEVRSVYDKRNMNALNTVGYKELFDYLDGRWSLDEAVERIKGNTRRYARKQLTWFKRDENMKWFHPDQQQDILNYITNNETISQ
jgi:hypothetical protein